MALPVCGLIVSGAESQSADPLIELYSVTANFTVDTTVKYGGGAASWKCVQDASNARNGVLKARNSAGLMENINVATAYGGCHIRVHAVSATSTVRTFMEFRDNAGTVRAQLQLRWNSGSWQIFVKAGTHAERIATLLSLDTWYWITFKYEADAGNTHLWCDVYASNGGALLDSGAIGSGVAGANLADIVLGRTDATETETYEMNFDDVFDSAEMDPPEIEIRSCIANVDNTYDWHATTGYHWQSIDDIPYSDTETLYANATDSVGDQDRFAFNVSNLNPDWEIFGVVPYMVAKKGGVVGLENPIFVVFTGSTEDTSSSVAASASYRGYAIFLQSNFDTSDVWLYSEMGEILVGCELAGAVPITQMNVADLQMWVIQIVEAPPSVGVRGQSGVAMAPCMMIG